jgi:hypothetical protein
LARNLIPEARQADALPPARITVGLYAELLAEGARIMDGAGRGFPPGDLRVSDADRDRALSELSEAFRVGRITADEFDQRSGQALGARTGKELTALLADLPLDRPPATRTTAPEPAGHAVAVRAVTGASAVAAAVLSLIAVANALTPGPTLQQRELLQALAARQGLSIPLPPSPAFNWAGTITPAAMAVLLIALIIFLRVARVGRT